MSLILTSISNLLLPDVTRAVVKYPELKTWISNLAQCPTKRNSWFSRARSLKKIEDLGKDENSDAFRRKNNQTLMLKSMNNYVSAGFLKTRRFIHLASSNLKHVKSVQALLKCRVSGVFTPRKADQMKIRAHTESENRCPICGEGGATSLEHILVSCKALNYLRTNFEIDDDIQKRPFLQGTNRDEKLIARYLLGGEVPGGRASDWLQSDGTKLPLFVRVARFVDEGLRVMRVALWSMVSTPLPPRAKAGTTCRAGRVYDTLDRTGVPGEF